MDIIIKKLFVLISVALAFVTSGCVLCSAQPIWWTEYSLIDGEDREDSAIATIGQVKHALQKSYQYLEVELVTVGGAGEEVTELYNTYCITEPVDPENDLVTLTLSQLKYLAKPFYDRLNSTDVAFDTRSMNLASTDIYPWTVDQGDDADLALATLGQLKFVFSFDLSLWLSPADDTDRDNILDIWEQTIIDADPDDALATIADVLPGDDYDADGSNNLNEFIQQTNPLSSDHPELKLLLY